MNIAACVLALVGVTLSFFMPTGSNPRVISSFGMKEKFKKFSGVVMVFTLFLLFAGTAFAKVGNYTEMNDAKMIENILDSDPVLCGLFLVDVLIIAVRVRKVYHSMFTVWYFSFSSLLKELIIIFFVAGTILCVGPLLLGKAGLLNSTTLYIYSGAVFVLFCLRKSKKQKQQTDTQGQKPHQEQPLAAQKQTQSVIPEQKTATTQKSPIQTTPGKTQPEGYIEA